MRLDVNKLSPEALRALQDGGGKLFDLPQRPRMLWLITTHVLAFCAGLAVSLFILWYATKDFHPFR